MRGKQNTYNLIQKGSAIFMILALLWLTVSAPFVFSSQQELAKQDKIADNHSPLAGNEEDSSNPFSTTTEEKAPSSTTVSEEFLHDHHQSEHFSPLVSQYHKCENADTYNAFHGELLVPPPNAA